MKAVVYDRYGSPDVLEFRDVPKPVPRADEVLIRIRATTVSSGDWRSRSLEMPPGFGMIARLVIGVSGPRQPILGSELSGEVEEVGSAVTRFRVGDPVVAFTGASMGCHAEYRCIAQEGMVTRKPEKLSWEQAAALSFGGLTALGFLRRGTVEAGETVLVNGASGAVGTAAVQLAHHMGARVTAVCSGANAELVSSLGADQVIDYTREDFTRNGLLYDAIMDTAGTAPYTRSAPSLEQDGRCLLVLGGISDILRAPWVAMTGSKRIVAGPASSKPDDLRFLASLAEAGEFTPVIDRTYPFEQMRDAHRHVDTGRKRGNVVVTV